MSKNNLPQPHDDKQEPVDGFKTIGSLAAKLVANAAKKQAAK